MRRSIAAVLATTLAACGWFDDATQSLQGDPTRWEPFAGLGEVLAFAGPGAQLLQIRAVHVRSDGTMDLPADYMPLAYYELRMAQGEASTAPLGAGGGQQRNQLEVLVREPGTMGTRITGGNRTQFFNRGMRKEWATIPDPDLMPAPPPRCTAAALWQAAMARGAPPAAVALLEYDATGYTFQIADASVRMRFGHDCAPAAQ